MGYAIMTTRSLELNWKMRAFRVLPMFLLPGLSSITYSALVRFTRMCKYLKTLPEIFISLVCFKCRMLDPLNLD